jgi:hypothetical protein
MLNRDRPPSGRERERGWQRRYRARQRGARVGSERRTARASGGVELRWCLGRFPRSQARANSVAFAWPRQSLAGAVAGRRVAIGRRA